MRLLQDSINSLSKSPNVIASNYGMIALPLGHKAFELVRELLNQNRNGLRMSLKLTTDKMILTFIESGSPHSSVELIMDLPENLPEVITSIGSEEVNILGKNDIYFQHPYFRGKDRDETALLVSYRVLGIFSQVSPNNSGLAASGSTNSIPVEFQGNQVLSQSVRSECTFNATEDYSTENVAMLQFSAFSKSRALLSKAGRAKPQGDLILFFGKHNCLAQGVNAAGQETLPLQNAVTKKTLGSYKGPDGDEVYKLTFAYTSVFDNFLTTKRNRRPPIDLRYGVDVNGFQVVEADYDKNGRDVGDKVFTLRYVNRSVSMEILDAFPENGLSLVNLSGHAPTPTEEVEEVTLTMEQVNDPLGLVAALEQPSVETPEAWREAYVRQQTARGRSIDGGTLTDHFNAYVMEQVQAGNQIAPEEFELYNTLK